jgi:site-specific DNA-adenine methylase
MSGKMECGLRPKLKEIIEEIGKLTQEGKPIEEEAFVLDEDEFRAVAFRIKDMIISCKDFEEIINEHRNNPTALIFIDPPYLTKSNNYKDKDYLPKFILRDMRRLFKSLRRAKCRIILTHYMDEHIHEYAIKAGLKATFIYVSGINMKGEPEEPTVVYTKNMDFDLSIIESDSRVIYFDDDISFEYMESEVEKHYTEEKKIKIAKAKAKAKAKAEKTAKAVADSASKGGGDGE